MISLDELAVIKGRLHRGESITVTESKMLVEDVEKLSQAMDDSAGIMRRWAETMKRRKNLLLELEWANELDYCEVCDQYRRDGHSSHCELAQELKP